MKTLLTITAVAVLAFPVLAAETNKVSTPEPNKASQKYEQKVNKKEAEATAKAIAKEYKDRFKAGEIQLEVAGQARTVDLLNFDKSLTLGGNYYLTSGAGLHAAAGLRDLNKQFIDRAELGLVGRLPVPTIRAALIFGVGAEWQRITIYRSSQSGNERGKECEDSKTDSISTRSNRENQFSVYAEAGPLIRLSPYVDVFLKIRGVRPIESAQGEHIAIIAGTAITF